MQLWNFLLTSYCFQAIQVGTESCSGGTFTTEASCDATGYCYWEGSCKSRPCYLINEIAACRTIATTQTWTGVLSASCTAVTDKQFNLQQTNVCYKNSETQTSYAFIRLIQNMDGQPDASSDNTPLSTLTTDISVEKLKKLFTVNLNKATSLTQVSNILQAYIDYLPLLTVSKEAHPFYIEKIIYQALQYLRDYYYLRTDAMPPRTNQDRDAIIYKIDPIRVILMKRIASISPKYYQTNYQLINFAACPISRLRLTINGQLHTITVKINPTDYHTQGYIQMMTYPGGQFGWQGLSDAIRITFVDTSFNSISQQFSLIWTWSDPNLSVVIENVQLYIYYYTGPVLANPSAVTCNLAIKQCTSGILIGDGNYYFSYPLNGCSSLDEDACRIRDGCSWTTSCN